MTHRIPTKFHIIRWWNGIIHAIDRKQKTRINPPILSIRNSLIILHCCHFHSTAKKRKTCSFSKAKEKSITIIFVCFASCKTKNSSVFFSLSFEKMFCGFFLAVLIKFENMQWNEYIHTTNKRRKQKQ